MHVFPKRIEGSVSVKKKMKMVQIQNMDSAVELVFPIGRSPFGCPELITGISGGSEKMIHKLFEDDLAHAPAIIFIDAVEVIAGEKEVYTRKWLYVIKC